jgi:Ras family
VRAHADPHLTCILVGNKTDLATERRQVPTEEGEQWARDESLLFVEASAKSGANVEAAFEAAARDILVKIRRGVFDDDRVRLPTFPLSPPFSCKFIGNHPSHLASSCPSPRRVSPSIRRRLPALAVAHDRYPKGGYCSPHFSFDLV